MLTQQIFLCLSKYVLSYVLQLRNNFRKRAIVQLCGHIEETHTIGMNTETQKIQSGNKAISKELRTKANDFLNSRRHANNLVDIIGELKVGKNKMVMMYKYQSKKNLFLLQQSALQKQSIIPALLTLEVVFVELLKRREMSVELTPLKPKGMCICRKTSKYLAVLIYATKINTNLLILYHESRE